MRETHLIRKTLSKYQNFHYTLETINLILSLTKQPHYITITINLDAP